MPNSNTTITTVTFVIIDFKILEMLKYTYFSNGFDLHFCGVFLVSFLLTYCNVILPPSQFHAIWIIELKSRLGNQYTPLYSTSHWKDNSL